MNPGNKPNSNQSKNTMKKLFLVLAVALSGTWAHATLQLMNGSGSLNGDGGFGNLFSDQYTGLAGTAPLEPLGYNVEVELNITGGYNAGLYAYIIAPDGTISALIADPLSGNHYGGQPVAGTDQIHFFNYAGGLIANVIGQTTINDTVRPSDAPITISDATINAWGRNSLNFSLLIGYDDPNGPGATLNRWSLDLVPVPEPVDLALGLFAAMLLCLAGVRHFWRSVPKAEAKTEG
jgi:hypothetical protein